MGLKASQEAFMASGWCWIASSGVPAPVHIFETDTINEHHFGPRT